jgi:hypothetical protein
MTTEKVPYLEYSQDRRQVRCIICHGSSATGLGRHGIDSKSLRTHLGCAAHQTCWRNHLEHEKSRVAALEEFSDVSNAAAVSAFPGFQAIEPSYPPPMFMDPEPDSDLPIYHRVFSTEELAQELGADSEERAVLTLEEKQSNLREQYEQMLLDTYQADHLDSEDGVEDQFLGDGIPKTVNIAEGEEEDEQCFDPAALSSPAYHPYPSKVVSMIYFWLRRVFDTHRDGRPCFSILWTIFPVVDSRADRCP